MPQKRLSLLLVAVAALSSGGIANAQEVLSGDTRLACEAILCLASGTRPSECAPSLNRYFGITAKRLSGTIRKRWNFLNLCPEVNQTPEMSALLNAMSNGAGRCDARTLNRELRRTRGLGGDTGDDGWEISNKMSGHCAAYTNHAYTDLHDITPRYVGVPEHGGYWVEPNEYDQALTEYNARLEAQRRQNRENGWWQ